MNLDSSDLFGTTPPRTRSRNKNKPTKFSNGPNVTNSTGTNPTQSRTGHSRKSSFSHVGQGFSKQIFADSPRNSFRKKKSTMMSHLRDAKFQEMTERDKETESFNSSDIMIGRTTNSSDVLTVDVPHPLRCLSASCISEHDLSGTRFQNKSGETSPNSKSKSGNKKMPKSRNSKLSPGDQHRLQYMQRLRQVVLAGNSKQLDLERNGTDKNSPKYELRRNELIWLELQSWHNGLSIVEQDQRLYDARQQLVAETLSYVSEFQFDENSISALDVLNSKYKSFLCGVTCDEWTSYMLPNIFTDFENSGLSEKILTLKVQNSVATCKGETSDERNENRPDINLSEVDGKGFSEYPPGDGSRYDMLLFHEILPDYKHMEDQDNAVLKIGEILKHLCIIENLYSSSCALSKDYPYYKDQKFQCKIEYLCSWYNLTLDLNGKFLTVLNAFLRQMPSSFREWNRSDSPGSSDETSSPSHYSLVSESSFNNCIRSHTNRLLKQKSMSSILHRFLNNHFMGLFRAKINMMPRSFYTDDEVNFLPDEPPILEMTNVAEESPEGATSSTTFTSRELFGKELGKLLQQVHAILPGMDLRINEQKCLDLISEQAKPVSSSSSSTAVFGLPSFQSMFLFFPSILLAIMRHCMILHSEQAMPFFNSSGSSVCLLTAKQLVMESKEMLKCGLLARDIFCFFIADILDEEMNRKCVMSVTYFEDDLHNIINTYLDFLNVWLVRMLSDLPLAPRGFQDILEQEWDFSREVSPRIDLNCVITCNCRFIVICSDIVKSTVDFLTTATEALTQPHRQDHKLEFNSQQSVEEEAFYSSSSSNSTCGSTDNYLQTKTRAGMLWFQRQRSESPHLSRSNSLRSSGSCTPTSPSIDLDQKQPPSLISSGSNLPWFQYKRTTSQVEYQRRFLFELCRAIRELSNEMRERAIRVLSFVKRLRKSLEPAIGYNLVREQVQQNITGTQCAYCSVLSTLHQKGFVAIDLTAITLNDNINNNANNDSKYVDFRDYWVLLQGSLRYPGEDADGKVGLLGKLLKHTLFNHLHVSRNESEEMQALKRFKEDLGFVLFVKKMPDFHQTVVLPDARRKSEDSTHPKKKKTNNRKNKKQKDKVESDRKDDVSSCSNEKCAQWLGAYVALTTSDISQHDLNLFHEVQRHFELQSDITAILASANDLGVTRKELNNTLAPMAKVAVAQMPVVRNVKVSFDALRLEVIQLCIAMMDAIDKALQCLTSHSENTLKHGMTRIGSFDMDSQQQIRSEVNEVMQTFFNFGFEFIKETTRIMSGDFRYKMDKIHMDFAKQWMDYVMKNRKQGKGHRPRWASQGLTFVVSLDTGFLLTLPEGEYASFKHQIDSFISHIIGKSNSENSIHLPKKTKSSSFLEVPEREVPVLRSLSSSPGTLCATKEIIRPGIFPSNASIVSETEENLFPLPIDRVRDAIRNLEDAIEYERYEAKQIGCVSHTRRANAVFNLGVRTVSFRWQRGTKIGEGAFGRVYTCVNVDTGTILAMKEVKFQPNDQQKIRSALDEITNFEGIQHPNLVHYHGVELHREEMYIFMEYCDGGTLGELCKINLPEMMIRKYTAQILRAVHALHLSGIVHRDIKGSNIFLTSSGIVKLGDFGSALKLRDKFKTIPGEMVSHIGTTMAYTAPEVINSSEKVGYGRAADIWSLGCVVIEMASGKKPWHDLLNFQVMFKVGNGNAPPIPDKLTTDGKRFIKCCTIPEPKNRWTADQLLGHAFIKVVSDD